MLRGQKKLTHLFTPKTVGLIMKAFQCGLSVKELAHLMAVEPALIEEFIRMVMTGKPIVIGGRAGREWTR